MIATKGDLIMGYKTMPVEFGRKNTKNVILLLQTLTISIPFFLYMIKGVSMIMLYFLFSAILIAGTMIMQLVAEEIKTYSLVNTVYKVILLAGVASIILF